MTGNLVTFTGATNTTDDGFAAQFVGSFTSITYSTTGSAADSQSFTVAISPVPEPSSLALCGVAALTGLGFARARRRPTSA